MRRTSSDAVASELIWKGSGFVGLSSREILSRRAASQSGAVRRKRAGGQAKKRLREAEGLLKQGDKSAFFAALAKAIHGYASDKLGTSLTGLTNEQMRSALKAKGISDPVSEQLIGELENCDFARFAPSAGGADEMREALDRSARLIDALEAS